jgi:hypothetical protein
MKFKLLLIGTALAASSLSFVSVSLAQNATEQVPKGAIYSGSGYKVSLLNDSYRRCDSQPNCTTIENPTKKTPQLSIWRNSGYTYSISFLDSPNGKPHARLKVQNTKGKVILNTAMIL